MIIIPPPLQFPRPRPKKNKNAPAPTPPSSGPHVVSVTHAADPTQMSVTLSADLQAIEGFDQAMRVFIPGLYWVGSNMVDYVDARTVTITFTEDVSAATIWMTPFPEVWEFVSGDAMGLPFAGVIS